MSTPNHPGGGGGGWPVFHPTTPPPPAEVGERGCRVPIYGRTAAGGTAPHPAGGGGGAPGPPKKRADIFRGSGVETGRIETFFFFFPGAAPGARREGKQKKQFTLPPKHRERLIVFFFFFRATGTGTAGSGCEEGSTAGWPTNEGFCRGIVRRGPVGAAGSERGGPRRWCAKRKKGPVARKAPREGERYNRCMQSACMFFFSGFLQTHNPGQGMHGSKPTTPIRRLAAPVPQLLRRRREGRPSKGGGNVTALRGHPPGGPRAAAGPARGAPGAPTPPPPLPVPP